MQSMADAVGVAVAVGFIQDLVELGTMRAPGVTDIHQDLDNVAELVNDGMRQHVEKRQFASKVAALLDLLPCSPQGHLPWFCLAGNHLDAVGQRKGAPLGSCVTDIGGLAAPNPEKKLPVWAAL